VFNQGFFLDFLYFTLVKRTFGLSVTGITCNRQYLNTEENKAHWSDVVLSLSTPD